MESVNQTFTVDTQHSRAATGESGVRGFLDSVIMWPYSFQMLLK